MSKSASIGNNRGTVTYYIEKVGILQNLNYDFTRRQSIQSLAFGMERAYQQKIENRGYRQQNHRSRYSIECYAVARQKSAVSVAGEYSHAPVEDRHHANDWMPEAQKLHQILFTFIITRTRLIPAYKEDW